MYIEGSGRGSSPVADFQITGASDNVVATGSSPSEGVKDFAGTTVERFQANELFGNDLQGMLFSAVFDFGKKIFSGEIDVKPFLENFQSILETFGGPALKDFPIGDFLKMIQQPSMELFMQAGKTLMENPEFTKTAFDAVVGLIGAAV